MSSKERESAGWVTHFVGKGKQIRVRSGSLAALAAEAAEASAFRRQTEFPYSMDWSLGLLGDLMWMRLPESRPFIYAAAREEFERAIERDDELMPISIGDLADEVFWFELLKPAIDAYPASDADVRRYCEFLRLVLDMEGDPGATLRHVFHPVIRWITDVNQHKQVVSAVDPALVSRLEQRTRSE